MINNDMKRWPASGKVMVSVEVKHGQRIKRVAVGTNAGVFERQAAVVVELAQGTLFHEHGKVHVGFGAGKVVRCDRDSISRRRLRDGLRLRNSGGDASAAVPLFQAAAEGAASADLVFLQVDALHMLGIADPDRADEWTGQALAALDGTTEARTRGPTRLSPRPAKPAASSRRG
jgi:hypothetical protein